jgi:hypothetical protein
MAVVKIRHRSARAFDVSGAPTDGTPLALTTGMVRPLACFVIAAAVFGGACTSTHHRARPVSVAELATRAEADTAGGASFEIVFPAIRPLGGATPAPVSTDSTEERPLARYAPDAVYVATPGEPTRLLLPEVSGYQVKRYRRGALEGALIGTAVGALTGALIGASQGSDPAPVPMCTNLDGGTICTIVGGRDLSAGEKATMTGVALGVTGAGVGALIGLLVGHTDRFEF